MGNFVLTLADHAQNGFFHPSEWIGVVASAWAVEPLRRAGRPRQPPALAARPGRHGAQVVVGMLGFYLHIMANFRSPAGPLWDRFLYGAPLFAPLLFADLAMLAAIGIVAVARPHAPPASLDEAVRTLPADLSE